MPSPAETAVTLEPMDLAASPAPLYFAEKSESDLPAWASDCESCVFWAAALSISAFALASASLVLTISRCTRS